MLLVLGISFLFAVSSFAQVKISGGILAGLNMANASIDPSPSGVSLGTRTGFGFGGVLDFSFAGGVGIHVEPMYLQKGTKATYTGGETDLKVNYIEIPAMLTYTFDTGAGQVEPYVMAGPTFGIRLSATSTTNNVDTDIKSTTKSTDFGATFGAGARLPVGMNSLFLEARYSIGFSDVNNDPTAPNTTIKTKGFQIFAGITFPFGA